MNGPIKVVVVGDSDTGKTAITQTFCNPETDIDKLSSTVGVAFESTCVTVDDQQVKLTIWDTAGQERFKSLCASYYRGARVILVVYDVTNKQSFDNIQTWIEEAKAKSIVDGAVFVIVGNKIDLSEERTVSREQGEDLAQKIHAIFVETSARTHERVEEPFMLAVRKTIEIHMPQTVKQTVRLEQKIETTQSFGCC